MNKQTIIGGALVAVLAISLAFFLMMGNRDTGPETTQAPPVNTPPIGGVPPAPPGSAPHPSMNPTASGTAGPGTPHAKTPGSASGAPPKHGSGFMRSKAPARGSAATQGGFSFD
jgi:hypothetical protein